MSVKKFALALFATLALAAAAAGPAAAHPGVETSSYWYKDGVKLAGVKEPITCASTGSFTLEGHTVDVLGTLPFKLSATGLSCPGAKIANQGNHALMTGALKLTGVKGIEPACEINHGTILTEPIKGQVWMEEGTSKPLLRLVPASGTLFAEIVPLAGCALSEDHPLDGAIFVEFTSATATSAATQQLVFSGPINATASGVSNALTLDGDPASLTGSASISLTSGGLLAVSES